MRQIIWQDDRLEVIPLSRVVETIRKHHVLDDGSHSGILKTYDNVARHCYGVSREMVEEFVDHCDICCSRMEGLKRMQTRAVKNAKADEELPTAEAALIQIAEKQRGKM